MVTPSSIGCLQMLTSETPAERHRAVAHGFTVAVESVTNWDTPTPVHDWLARDVVIHLTTWLPGFLQHNLGSTFAVPSRPSVVLLRLGSSRRMLSNRCSTTRKSLLPNSLTEHLGRMTVASCLDMIYTPDVFMHSWDLGRSAGIDCTLDPDYCLQLLAGMQQMDQAMRDSGHYGPKPPYLTRPTRRRSCSHSSGVIPNGRNPRFEVFVTLHAINPHYSPRSVCRTIAITRRRTSPSGVEMDLRAFLRRWSALSVQLILNVNRRLIHARFEAQQ